MARGKFNEIKAKPWKGEDLKGGWDFTLKIDGARMLRDIHGNPVSRAGKPLYNLDDIPDTITDAEIFDTNWETSMSLVRSSKNGSPVPLDKVYTLTPLDSRLKLFLVFNPTKEFINEVMQNQVAKGFEGLILRQGDKWLKVKPKETADVLVTGFQYGTGKHEDSMGALLTTKGKVGTGFSDIDRMYWYTMYELHGLQWLTKQLIEVEYMELTTAGKFRHPRFIRIRDDKTEESL